MLDTVDALADRLLDAFACWGGPDGFARAVQSGEPDACGLCAVVEVYAAERIGATSADVAGALRRAAVRRGMPPPRVH